MSEVSICNQALSWVGEDPITSLNDPTTKAESLCKANYAPLRDAVLEAHNWTFAIARYNVAKLTTSPEYGYANQFTIPGEVLRVISVNKLALNDVTRDWQIEGENIVTDDTTCKMMAVIRVTDPNKFSAMFEQALAARLAEALSIPITKSLNIQQAMMEKYDMLVRKAISIDNIQGKSKRLRSRWLQNARLSSGPRSIGPVV